MILMLVLCVTGCASILLPHESDKVLTIDDLSDADQKHYELAQHYIQSHHYNAAEKKLNELITRYPLYADLYNSYGVLWERRGRMTKASESFLKAITLNLNHQVALENYGVLLCHSDNEQFIVDGDRSKNHKKLLSRLYSAASKCYISRNNFNLAQESIEKAITLDNEFALNYLYLAQIYYHNQLYHKAILALDRFNDLNGYSKKSAQLGVLLSVKLNNEAEINRYRYILSTQFNEESSEE